MGVSIFKGKPRKAQLQPIADKIKGKLAKWKGATPAYGANAIGKFCYPQYVTIQLHHLCLTNFFVK